MEGQVCSQQLILLSQHNAGPALLDISFQGFGYQVSSPRKIGVHQTQQQCLFKFDPPKFEVFLLKAVQNNL